MCLLKNKNMKLGEKNKNVAVYDKYKMSLFRDGSHLNGKEVSTLSENEITKFVEILNNFEDSNVIPVYSKPFKGYDKVNDEHYESTGYFLIAYNGIPDADFKWNDDLEEIDRKLHKHLKDNNLIFE